MIEIDNIYNDGLLEGMKQIPDGTIDAVIWRFAVWRAEWRKAGVGRSRQTDNGLNAYHRSWPNTAEYPMPSLQQSYSRSGTIHGPPADLRPELEVVPIQSGYGRRNRCSGFLRCKAPLSYFGDIVVFFLAFFRVAIPLRDSGEDIKILRKLVTYNPQTSGERDNQAIHVGILIRS